MKRSLMLNTGATHGEIIGDVQRFTSNTTFTVPQGAKSMDYFLVGGGGGGGAWNTWGYSRGIGGNGGRIVNGSVEVIPGQEWYVIIGTGGVKAGNSSPGIKSAGDGGSTELYTSGYRFTALGGEGGYNSVSSNQSSGGMSPSDFVKQYGTYHTYTGTDGTVYYQGPIVNYNAGPSIINCLDQVLIDDQNNLPLYNSLENQRVLDGLGIPEFLEKGNPTHAISGPTVDNLVCPATIGPTPERCINSLDEISTWSGGGYGYGGRSGHYRENDMKYGGNGYSGIVCVRFRN